MQPSSRPRGLAPGVHTPARQEYRSASESMGCDAPVDVLNCPYVSVRALLGLARAANALRVCQEWTKPERSRKKSSNFYRTTTRRVLPFTAPLLPFARTPGIGGNKYGRQHSRLRTERALLLPVHVSRTLSRSCARRHRLTGSDSSGIAGQGRRYPVAKTSIGLLLRPPVQRLLAEVLLDLNDPLNSKANSLSFIAQKRPSGARHTSTDGPTDPSMFKQPQTLPIALVRCRM